MLEEQRRLHARNRDLEGRLRQLRDESEGIIAELTAEIEKLRDLAVCHALAMPPMRRAILDGASAHARHVTAHRKI